MGLLAEVLKFRFCRISSGWIVFLGLISVARAMDSTKLDGVHYVCRITPYSYFTEDADHLRTYHREPVARPTSPTPFGVQILSETFFDNTKLVETWMDRSGNAHSNTVELNKEHPEWAAAHCQAFGVEGCTYLSSSTAGKKYYGGVVTTIAYPEAMLRGENRISFVMNQSTFSSISGEDASPIRYDCVRR